MKKTIQLLLIFSLLFVVLGCSEAFNTTEEQTLSQLNTPTNLNIEGNMVSWDEVEEASSYDIYLNEISFNVSTNYYLLEEEGSYDIKVIAKGEGYLDSLPTEIISTTISYEINVTYDLEVSDGIISWDEIEDANEYRIYINDEVYLTTDTNYNLDEIEAGLLIVKLQAIYPVGEANPSEEVLIEHNLESARDLNFQYSTNSTQNILIMDLDSEKELLITDGSGELLEVNNILVKNNYYEIRADYINTQEDNNLEFYIYYDNIKHKVNITIQEKINPFIISSSIVYTNGEENIKLQFELFDGDFRQITGTNLEESDYSIEDNILTINSNYINSRFQTEDSFSINYALETDEIVIGLIVFNQETE